MCLYSYFYSCFLRRFFSHRTIKWDHFSHRSIWFIDRTLGIMTMKGNYTLPDFKTGTTAKTFNFGGYTLDTSFWRLGRDSSGCSWLSLINWTENFPASPFSYMRKKKKLDIFSWLLYALAELIDPCPEHRTLLFYSFKYGLQVTIAFSSTLLLSSDNFLSNSKHSSNWQCLCEWFKLLLGVLI